MNHLQAIEGTGAEIARFATEHPRDHFLLVPMVNSVVPKTFDSEALDQALARIARFKGKFPVLPDESFSTECLYD